MASGRNLHALQENALDETLTYIRRTCEPIITCPEWTLEQLNAKESPFRGNALETDVENAVWTGRGWTKLFVFFFLLQLLYGLPCEKANDWKNGLQLLVNLTSLEAFFLSTKKNDITTCTIDNCSCSLRHCFLLSRRQRKNSGITHRAKVNLLLRPLVKGDFEFGHSTTMWVGFIRGANKTQLNFRRSDYLSECISIACNGLYLDLAF